MELTEGQTGADSVVEEQVQKTLQIIHNVMSNGCGSANKQAKDCSGSTNKQQTMKPKSASPETDSSTNGGGSSNKQASSCGGSPNRQQQTTKPKALNSSADSPVKRGTPSPRSPGRRGTTSPQGAQASANNTGQVGPTSTSPGTATKNQTSNQVPSYSQIQTRSSSALGKSDTEKGTTQVQPRASVFPKGPAKPPSYTSSGLELDAKVSIQKPSKSRPTQEIDNSGPNQKLQEQRFDQSGNAILVQGQPGQPNSIEQLLNDNLRPEETSGKDKTCKASAASVKEENCTNTSNFAANAMAGNAMERKTGQTAMMNNPLVIGEVKIKQEPIDSLLDDDVTGIPANAVLTEVAPSEVPDIRNMLPPMPIPSRGPGIRHRSGCGTRTTHFSFTCCRPSEGWVHQGANNFAAILAILATTMWPTFSVLQRLPLASRGLVEAERPDVPNTLQPCVCWDGKPES